MPSGDKQAFIVYERDGRVFLTDQDGKQEQLRTDPTVSEYHLPHTLQQNLIIGRGNNPLYIDEQEFNAEMMQSFTTLDMIDEKSPDIWANFQGNLEIPELKQQFKFICLENIDNTVFLNYHNESDKYHGANEQAFKNLNHLLQENGLCVIATPGGLNKQDFAKYGLEVIDIGNHVNLVKRKGVTYEAMVRSGALDQTVLKYIQQKFQVAPTAVVRELSSDKSLASPQRLTFGFREKEEGISQSSEVKPTLKFVGGSRAQNMGVLISIDGEESQKELRDKISEVESTLEIEIKEKKEEPGHWILHGRYKQAIIEELRKEFDVSDIEDYSSPSKRPF